MRMDIFSRESVEFVLSARWISSDDALGIKLKVPAKKAARA